MLTSRTSPRKHEQGERNGDDQAAVARQRPRTVSSHAQRNRQFRHESPRWSGVRLMRTHRRARNASLPPDGRGAMLGRVTRCDDIEWRVSEAPVPYEDALRFMEERVAAIRAGRATSASGCSSIRPCSPPEPAPTPRSCSIPIQFPVYEAGRGGRYTYHGPGSAGRLSDARPRKARQGHPLLRPCARGLDDRRAGRSRMSRRIARRDASASGSAKAPTRRRSAPSAFA